MSFAEYVTSAMPFLFVIAAAALIWLGVELAVTVRRARRAIDDVQKQVEPTLASLEAITESLEPAAAKIDPLIDRASLTIDAANLEIMRVDQILEDVSEVTDTLSTAANAMNDVASAPAEIVNTITDKVRGAFKTRHASPESSALGAEKAVGEGAPAPARHTPSRGATSGSPYAAPSAQQHSSAQPRQQASAANTKPAGSPSLKSDVFAQSSTKMAETLNAVSLKGDESEKPGYFTYSNGIEGEPSATDGAANQENDRL